MYLKNKLTAIISYCTCRYIASSPNVQNINIIIPYVIIAQICFDIIVQSFGSRKIMTVHHVRNGNIIIGATHQDIFQYFGSGFPVKNNMSSNNDFFPGIKYILFH